MAIHIKHEHASNRRLDSRHTQSLFSYVLIAISSILVGKDAQSADLSPQVWVNPGFYSYHFDRNPDLREDNIGVGVEVLLNPNHGLMAGTFVNSDRQRTRYGAYQWRPLHRELANVTYSAGLIAAALDGYPRVRNGDWFIAALPLVSVEWKRIGINFTIIPTVKDRLYGGVAAQVKLRIW